MEEVGEPVIGEGTVVTRGSITAPSVLLSVVGKPDRFTAKQTKAIITNSHFTPPPNHG